MPVIEEDGTVSMCEWELEIKRLRGALSQVLETFDMDWEKNVLRSEVDPATFAIWRCKIEPKEVRLQSSSNAEHHPRPEAKRKDVA